MDRRLTGLNPLSYMGVEPVTPPQLVIEQRDPTMNDSSNVVIGTVWVTKVNSASPASAVWMLIGLAQARATWIMLWPELTPGSIVFQEDSGSATIFGGIVNVNGHTNIQTNGFGNVIQISTIDNPVFAGPVTISNIGPGVVYANAFNTLTSIANGTDGEVLVIEGGVPVWDIAPGAIDTVITNSGVINPVGTLGILGGNNTSTRAFGINAFIDVIKDFVTPGNGSMTFANASFIDGVLQTDGSGTVFANNGDDGQVLIGATGLPAAWADITSTSLVVATGPNTIAIDLASTTATTFTCDAGPNVNPSSNVLIVEGGSNINTFGVAPNIVEINLDSVVVIPHLGTLTVTDLVGPGTVRVNNVGLFSSFPDGANSTIMMIGNAGALSWGTLTGAGGVTVTPGASGFTITGGGGGGGGTTLFHNDGITYATMDNADNSVTIVGSGNITVTGDDVHTSTVAISNSPSFSGTVTAGTGFTATTGNITASAGNISSSGSITAGNALNVTTGAVTVGSFGKGILHSTAGGVVTPIAGEADTKIIIGVTATAPVWGNITSTGGSVTISYPSATAINLEAAGVAALTTLGTDTGDSAPLAGKITIAGGLNINTSNATPHTVTVNLDTSINQPATTGAGVGMYSLNSVHFMHNFSLDGSNTFLGGEAGNLTLTTSENNVGLGIASLTSLTTGSSNASLGGGSAVTTGGSNVFAGVGAGFGLVTGSNNIILGTGAAANYNGAQSSNIIINNPGNVLDANIIRIGTQGSGAGQQANTYIAGIYNTVFGATSQIVSVDSNGKLGSSTGTDGQVLIGSTAGSPSWSTLTEGAGITITNNPGSITITNSGGGGGGGATNFPTNSGTAIQALGVLNVFGGSNMNTVGAGNTVTVNLNNSIAWPSTDINGGTPGGYDGLIRIDSLFFMHAYGTRNTFLGESAGNLTLTTASATDNLGLGANSLTSITTGQFNTSAGSSAGQSLTTGSNNSFYGRNSGEAVTTGGSNVLIGTGSGAGITTGSFNIAIGRQALSTLSTTSNSTAIGYQALQAQTNGAVSNVAVGYQAGISITSSSGNCLIGTGAGGSMTSGTGLNTIVGQAGLFSLTTGHNNTALGYQVGYDPNGITTGSSNILVGMQAGADFGGAESNNIIIGNRTVNGSGVFGDNGVIRIGGTVGNGNNGDNTACYVGGISNTGTANGSYTPVFVDTDGKLFGDVSGTGTFLTARLAPTWTSITSPRGTITVGSGGLTLDTAPNAAFLYKGGIGNDVTGNGAVVTVGSLDKPVKVFDQLNNVSLGGVGNPTLFTAPQTGKYVLQFIVEATNVPPPVAPNPPFVSVSSCPMFIVCTSRTVQMEPIFQGVLGVTSTCSNELTTIIDMTAGDTAQFQWSLTTPAGTQTVGAGANTYIGGFLQQID